MEFSPSLTDRHLRTEADMKKLLTAFESSSCSVLFDIIFIYLKKKKSFK